MLKKLLILPLIWGFFWLTAFASATDYTIVLDNGSYSPSFVVLDSDWILTVSSVNWDNYTDNFCLRDSSFNYYGCYNYYWYDKFTWVINWWDYNQTSLDSSSISLSAWTYYFSESGANPFDSVNLSFSSSSDNNNSSSLVPTIPSSFTSWLTSLVSNFGATIVNWLPTIILVALGIYAIFALFRVVRWYSRSSFRW